MTLKILKLYNRACVDTTFINTMKIADNDKPPGTFADELSKHMWAAMYYGYIVAKFGSKWEDALI